MSKSNQKSRFRCFSLMLQPIWVRVLLIFLFSNSIFANGVLDPNFGNGGKVNFRFTTSSDDFGTAAALQPDGKIVIVGTSGLNGQSNGFRNFAVARLNTNGSLDDTFGNGGLVTTDFFNQEDVATAVAIQPDGKIVVGGNSAARFALARYNSDGNLDTTFSGGKVVTDFEESDLEVIRNVLIQPDGKIIAAGSYSGSFPSPPAQIALARYNINGTLDSSFGSNGKFTILFPRFSGFGGAAIQPDGKILITGNYVFPILGCVPSKGNSCETDQSFLLRYNPQMTLDKKFGRRLGKEFTGVGIGLADRLSAISLQSDGSILVSTGQAPKRYTSNGRLETTFEQVIFSNLNFTVHRAAQRPDGKIAGCGQRSGGNGYNDIGVVLFNAEGRLIGSDQRDFFGADDSCRAILTQPDNKIVVVGAAQIAQQSASSFAVIRYLDVTP